MTLSQKSAQSVEPHVKHGRVKSVWFLTAASEGEAHFNSSSALEEETSNLEGTELLPKVLYSVPKLVQKIVTVFHQ